MFDLIFPSLKINPEDTEACVSFWRKLGFLDGIKDTDLREKCAVGFTLMARFMYGGDSRPSPITAVTGVSMEYIILPIVRRVITSTGKPLTNAESFYWFCKDFISEKADHYEKMRGRWFDVGIDSEAQLTRELSDNAIAIINSFNEEDSEQECDTTTQ